MSYIYIQLSRPWASAQNIVILSRTHEQTGVFKVSANIGSHFKNCHKNTDLPCTLFFGPPLPLVFGAHLRVSAHSNER